ncbi:MAG: polysaccharide deacetylase family protein [Desulfobacteraceae bacterium]|nr:polysaccharide deacetylase family protein [Desulfobacteraceae bacterium]
MSMRIFLKNCFVKFMDHAALPLYGAYELKNRLLTDSKAAILVYHKISDLEDGIDAFWNVSPALFARHMAYLAENGFNVLSLDQLCDHIARQTTMPEKSVVLTFDDGYANVYRHAYPVLREYGFPATIFLTGRYTGRNRLYWWDRQLTAEKPDMFDEVRTLAWSEIEEMQSSGLIAFGSHSMSHDHIGKLSPRRMEYELGTSRAYLERKLKRRVRYFAYPGGIREYGDVSDETARVLARSGYELACTSETGRNGLRESRYALKRIGMGRNDNIQLFRAKLVGGYDWVGYAQRAFHRVFKSPW